MSRLKKAQEIARYLKTKYESKNHGGYLCYEDDKIAIYLDTYVPNTEVHVVNGSKKTLVMHYNGAHSRFQDCFQGAWEEYIDELYLKAVEAKKRFEDNKKQKEDEEKTRKHNEIQNEINAVFGEKNEN